jgi:hypothetical protein
VDAVGGDDNVGFGGGAVGKRNAGNVAGLLKGSRAVAGVHDAGGQRGGEEIDEVGAVHPEGGVPARRVGHLHGRDGGAVVAEVMRAGADPRAPLLHRRSQAHPL